MPNYDFLVFIGRFQPFHKGHLSVVEEGLRQAGQMIILCGSAHQPRSVRNAWSFSEREAMIRASLTAEQNDRTHILPLMDALYNDEDWVRNVQAAVSGLVSVHHSVPHKKAAVGLIGHSKDQSSYYLNLFPQWHSVAVANLDEISATPIREDYLTKGEAFDSSLLPAGSLQAIAEHSDSEALRNIADEYAFIKRYRDAWQAAPYAPTFLTVDAVVVQSGHVLLVERKARPGKGLYALPGGFLDADETMFEGCLRELREETRLKVPAPVLKGSLRDQQMFDDPYRSARGRTVTQAFYFELEPRQELPKVRGGDDAKQAFWLPLADLDPNELFEDHYFIIRRMTGI